MPGVLYPPVSAMTDSGETGYSLGSRPQCTLNMFSFFSLYLLEFSETSFANLNCGFQKDCKITVLNLKNKIFIFNLKVKLEGKLKAVIFQTEKENPHVTPSQNTGLAAPPSSASSPPPAARHRKACPGLAGAGEAGTPAPPSPGCMGRLLHLLPKFKWH